MKHGVGTVATAVLVGISLTAGAFAQSEITDVHQLTSAIPGARFEIIQSELAAKWTFRLDRFSGHVWQLVKTKDDDDAWEAMRIVGLPVIANPSTPRFQIFSSGIAVKFTFLIDTVSGQTWTLTTLTNKGRPAGETLWEPFEQ
jgi:hypothetical protein